jgi:hypothetical protein
MDKNVNSSTPESVDHEIRRVCSILEKLAQKCASDSEEALAIRDAALAYTVVWQHDVLKKKYLRLRAAFGGQLTDEMMSDLRRHGIEPDDLEDAEPDSVGADDG